jgi:hypothetical protein
LKDQKILAGYIAGGIEAINLAEDITGVVVALDAAKDLIDTLTLRVDSDIEDVRRDALAVLTAYVLPRSANGYYRPTEYSLFVAYFSQGSIDINLATSKEDIDTALLIAISGIGSLLSDAQYELLDAKQAAYIIMSNKVDETRDDLIDFMDLFVLLDILTNGQLAIDNSESIDELNGVLQSILDAIGALRTNAQVELEQKQQTQSAILQAYVDSVLHLYRADEQQDIIEILAIGLENIAKASTVAGVQAAFTDAIFDINQIPTNATLTEIELSIAKASKQAEIDAVLVGLVYEDYRPESWQNVIDKIAVAQSLLDSATTVAGVEEIVVPVALDTLVKQPEAGSGDPFGDGPSIDIVVLALQYIAGINVNLTPQEIAALDMNGDTFITMEDVFLLMTMIP